MRLSKEEMMLLLKWYKSYQKDTGSSIVSADLKSKIEKELNK